MRNADAFGVARLTTPAWLRGKTLKLTGYLKAENVREGYAGLWLRVEGDGGTLAFNNMQKKGLHGSFDWQPYTMSCR